MLHYHPLPAQRPGEVVVSPWSMQSIGVPMYTGGSLTIAAAAWPAIGLVIYVPFSVPEPVLVTKLWWGVGAAAGNLDCGLYQEDGTLIVSTGTTAAAGSAAVQSVDITDTLLARGAYYMALVADTTTTLTIERSAPAAGILQSYGLLEQASVTLPLATNASPATFAKYTRAYVPLFGLQGYRTVGV